MKKLLVWMAIGFALKYFLDTDKGQEVKQQVKDMLGDAKDTFNEYFKTVTDKATGTANRARNAMNNI